MDGILEDMKQRAYGFTIVELLIVIVVIAILAVIAVVAYSGIQNQAVESSIRSSLKDAQTRLALEYTTNDVYPATEAAMRTLTGLKDGGSIVYRYSYDANGPSYCLSGVSDRDGVNAFRVTNEGSSPQQGACSGHDGPIVSTITNHSVNPSVETVTTGFGGPNGSTIARDTSRAYTGAASLRVTMPTAGGSSAVGALVYQRSPFASYLQPNTTYTVSAYVYVPTGTVDLQLSIQGSGRASTAPGSDHRTSVKNQWTRIHRTFTTNDGGNITTYVLNDAAVPAAGTQFWVDSVMLTEGSSPYTYADGESEGWSWSGSQHTSTSSGPAL